MITPGLIKIRERLASVLEKGRKNFTTNYCHKLLLVDDSHGS